MNKRFFQITVSLFVLLVFFMAGQVFAAPRRLQLAHQQSELHNYHYGAVQFANLLKEYTNGELEVDLFPGGVMGRDTAMAESVAMGTLDFASLFSIILEPHAWEFGVLTLPFCFSSWDHAFKVLDGPIGDELRAAIEPKNIKVLDFWTNGLAEINSNAEIRIPADIKGKKFRIQEGPSYTAISHALSSVSTPMSIGEVYSALQLGTIDVQLQTVNNMYFNKHQEVAPFFTPIGMCHNTQPLIMSMQTWNSLSKEHQDAVIRASREAAIRQRLYHQEDTIKCLNNILTEEGDKFKLIELSPEEKQQWRDAVAEVYENPQFLRLMDTFKRIQAEK